MSGCRIEPEPDEAERKAIAAALAEPPEEPSGWAEAALAEGVEGAEPEP